MSNASVIKFGTGVPEFGLLNVIIKFLDMWVMKNIPVNMFEYNVNR